MYTITVKGQAGQFNCPADSSVLEAMISHGLGVITIGCRAGGCGVCKLKVLSGQYQTKVMSRQKISINEEQAGYVLACRVYPSSDMLVEVVKKQHAATE